MSAGSLACAGDPPHNSRSQARLALILVLLTAVKGEIGWIRVVAWLGLVGGTFAAGGAALAFLADRSRHFASQNDFFSHVTATLQVDQGLAESLRLLLDELARAFEVEVALLAYRDTDLERIYIWRLRAGESERLTPESYSIARADGFLLDDIDASVCWNSLEGAGSGFGWTAAMAAGSTLPQPPAPPSKSSTSLHASWRLTRAGQPAAASSCSMAATLRNTPTSPARAISRHTVP